MAIAASSVRYALLCFARSFLLERSWLMLRYDEMELVAMVAGVVGNL
jgi:hypothetical protein